MTSLLPSRPVAWAIPVVALLALTGCPDTLQVTSTSPADNSTGANPTAPITATFDEPVDAATLAGKFELRTGGSLVPGSATASGATATFTPSAPLVANTLYVARVLAGVASDTGHPLDSDYQWSFTTGTSPFSVASTAPANGASGVGVGTAITVTFTQPVNAATVTPSSFTVADSSGTAVSGTVGVSGTQVTFTPSAPLATRTTYTVTVASSVASEPGTALGTAFTFSFATSSGLTGGVGGRVTYDWVPAQSTTEGGVKLNYANTQARPARRVQVKALVNGSTTLTTLTDDDGFYAFPSIGDGSSVQLTAYARTVATTYAPDGIGPEACSGASWDIQVVDNSTGAAGSHPMFALADSTARTSPAVDVNLHAATTYSGSAYTARAGAPFAIVDSLLSELEHVCEGSASVSLPRLLVNWSVNNTDGTYYTNDPAQGGSNLFIVGKPDVDTDEYDDHVIAHEMGHFIEDRLFRSDSIGGQHTMGDVLDPRVAFGEGYGNAISAISFDDPVYVDTSGPKQAGGFDMSMANPPTGNDRGVYSETSVMHFLWMLYENRDLAPDSGNFDRIYNVLRNFQTTTPALTTAQTFAAYYNNQYGGAAEGLQTLWGTTLGGSYNSLCVGTCSGSSGGTADVWDTDNDLGNAYAGTRTYASSTRSAEFWRLYKTVSGTGFAAPGTAHDVTVGVSGGQNKFGVQRWYRYVGTGAAKSVTPTFVNSTTCNTDVLDIDLYNKGFAGYAATGSGCDTISVPGASGTEYVIIFHGWKDTTGSSTDQPSGFGMQIQ